MPKTIYPSRICLNPTCPNKSFIPNRDDMKFCDSTCRSCYHSNKKKEENKTKYKAIQLLKQADKKLKGIYLSCQLQKAEFVTGLYLEHNQIDVLSAPEISIDQKTNNQIRWFFEYGVMGVGYEKFTVVKKSEYGKL